jgi:Flp pilus assembly pilin Flp
LTARRRFLSDRFHDQSRKHLPGVGFTALNEALVKFAPCHNRLVHQSMEFGTVLQYATLWLKLKTDRQAVTALEYGLIAGVIVATIAVGFSLLANDLSQQFENIGNSIAAE